MKGQTADDCELIRSQQSGSRTEGRTEGRGRKDKRKPHPSVTAPAGHEVFRCQIFPCNTKAGILSRCSSGLQKLIILKWYSMLAPFRGDICSSESVVNYDRGLWKGTAALKYRRPRVPGGQDSSGIHGSISLAREQISINLLGNFLDARVEVSTLDDGQGLEDGAPLSDHLLARHSE